MLFDDGKTATISECGRYRYRLGRRWADDGPACNFLMLNPSTADATLDDPTIRRCVGFARHWRCASLVVTNLFAFRATDPGDMRRAADPVGPLNDDHIEAVAIHAVSTGGLVVCAWGAHGRHRGRDRQVVERLRRLGLPLRVLRLTKDGSPSHPLYLPAALSPVAF